MTDLFSNHELWDQLRSAHWGKGPVVLRQPFGQNLASRGEVFEALCALGADPNRPTNPYVFIDGGWRPTDWDDLLPRDDDGSLDGYQSRIDSRMAGREFQVYIPDGIQTYHPDIWRRARAIAGHTGDLVGGIPPGGVMLETFIGRYRRTATGIHLDSSDNLSFVISGRKKMLFWPRSAFRSRATSPYTTHESAGTARYEDYLDTAIRLEAEPGDVFYWPRSYWHIAVDEDPDWVVTLNMPMWWHAPPKIALNHLLESAAFPRRDVEPAPYPADTAVSLQDIAAAPPASLTEELAFFRGVVASPVLDLMVKELWATVVTGRGFRRSIAPIRNYELAPDQVVAARDAIVALPFVDGQLLIAANGHTMKIDSSPAVTALIEALSAGRAIRAGDVADGAAQVLEFLGSVRALHLVDHTQA